MFTAVAFTEPVISIPLDDKYIIVEYIQIRKIRGQPAEATKFFVSHFLVT